MKTEMQKIVNLLTSSQNEFSKVATKKSYVIGSQKMGKYSHHKPIKSSTSSLESSLCDYSDAYVLVTEDIVVKNANSANLAADAKVKLKNSAPFINCRTEINGTFVDEAKFIYIIMPMYNLIEYSDNYSDTSGSLWQFKRDEIEDNANVTIANSSPFNYKSKFVGDTNNTEDLKDVKIVVPLKYLSNFWRSSEMPLINGKVELSLTWIKSCILAASVNIANDSIADAAKVTFKITDAKHYAPVVTLSIVHNAKL